MLGELILPGEDLLFGKASFYRSVLLYCYKFEVPIPSLIFPCLHLKFLKISLHES